MLPAVASTTRAGLGQSLCIGMGGDVLAGTNFVDALKVLEHDDDTEGIVLIGEIGGRAEEDAAEWIREYRKRTTSPKPIVALIGGVQAAPGRVMGHAGAFLVPGEPDAATKIKMLGNVGVTMVNHPAKFGTAMQRLLGDSGRASIGSSTTTSQRRGLHTIARRPLSRPISRTNRQAPKRTLYIRESIALDLLRQRGLNASEYSGKGIQRLLAISIDRSTLGPCIIAFPSTDAAESKSFPFDYRKGFDPIRARAVASHLQLTESHRDSLPRLLAELIDLFKTKEAFLLETKIVERLGELKITGARFGFDDAAYRSSSRQADIHSLRHVEDEIAAEVEAEKHGIVYIQLAGAGKIGTLVNGAGLAMNTVDALTSAGGEVANFLDTGGKATSETVKKSFEAVLGDERVKTIFVNIFGGLTRGDMIAEGVILAFKEVGVKVPVVVRIRGTREEEGQKLVSLILHSFVFFSFLFSSCLFAAVWDKG
jgi:succinyl-CoA synthetase alpha subunit